MSFTVAAVVFWISAFTLPFAAAGLPKRRVEVTLTYGVLMIAAIVAAYLRARSRV